RRYVKYSKVGDHIPTAVDDEGGRRAVAVEIGPGPDLGFRISEVDTIDFHPRAGCDRIERAIVAGTDDTGRTDDRRQVQAARDQAGDRRAGSPCPAGPMLQAAPERPVHVAFE